MFCMGYFRVADNATEVGGNEGDGFMPEISPSGG